MFLRMRSCTLFTCALTCVHVLSAVLPANPNMSQSSRSPRRARATSKREEAMRQYIKVAKQKKSSTSIGLKSHAQQFEDPLAGQMLVNVGRMEFDYNKMKGVLDKSFTTVKLPFHRDCTAEEMLTKCKENVWSDSTEDYQYYLADGSGTAIDSEKMFKLDLPDGSKESLCWTLNNYLKVSNVKFPSRLRVYCVRKLRIGTKRMSTGLVTVEIPQRRDELSSGSDMDTEQQLTVEQVQDEIEPPSGYFEVFFLGVKQSRYRKSHVFQSGLTQEAILTSEWTEDVDQRIEARDMLSYHSHKYRLLAVNPLEEGFYLDAIMCGKKRMSFIHGTNTETGEISYCLPSKESTFEVWHGCYASPTDSIALLACISLNGFHGISDYEWRKDHQLVGDTPLYFCTQPGIYICKVCCPGEKFVVEKFHVADLGKGLSITKLNDCECSETNKERSTLITESHIKCDVSTNTTAINGCSLTEPLIDNTLAEHIIQSCDDPNEVKLLCLVGSGAFGRVYKALWKGTVVAAKVMEIIGTEKVLQNELNVYRNLHHPNVLNFLGIVHEAHRILICTNFVTGKNLFEMVHNEDKKVPLTFQGKLQITVQIAQALVYMHSCDPPIAHLDLKPENILVENVTGHVFLSDFGLGKVITHLHKAGRTTMQAGTPAFQPPEQLKGEQCGTFCDIYALGCITVELFGEVQVWAGLAPHTIILKVADGNFPSVDHIPKKVVKLTQLCLTKQDQRATAPTVLKEICRLMVEK